MKKTKTYFEQIPVKTLKEMNVEIEKLEDGQIAPPILHCRMCRKPVSIESAKTDWDGKAIHEECYVISLTEKQMATKNRRAQPLI